MAVKTVFSEADFKAILAHYDLGDYRGAEPLSAGAVQTNYRLVTGSGAYAFRYYESRTRESVLFEVHLIRYLRKRHFPCAAPIADRRGGLVGCYRDKPYVFFEFIDGEHLENPTEKQRAELIQKAAQLQCLTRNYRPTYRQYRWNYGTELVEKLAEEAAERLGTDNARAKVDWVRQALADLHLPPSLPKGICHCDFHFSNALYRNGRLVALLDFDDANYTYLSFDLVNMLDYWAWPLDGEFDFDAARPIVQAYQQVRQLSGLEKRYLFDVHKLQILFDCIWFFERGAVDDFYERWKIEWLDSQGRANYQARVFD